MVVAVGLTIKLLPVPAKVPPQDPVYHRITSPVPPPPPLSVKVVLPRLQITVAEAVAETGSDDFVLTTRLTLLEKATVQDPTAAASVITTPYLDPTAVASAVVIFEIVKVAVLAPEISPPSTRLVDPFLH